MKIVSELIGDKAIISDNRNANSVHSKGSIGTLNKTVLELSFVETMYLVNKGKIEVRGGSKILSENAFMKKAARKENNFRIRFAVFKDLKDAGFVVKTALKYGFDFRVYDKGVKPGTGHAKWLIACFKESAKFSWRDYSKMMRVAHSVRKSAIIAVIDDESDVTYYESNWKKL